MVDTLPRSVVALLAAATLALVAACGAPSTPATPSATVTPTASPAPPAGPEPLASARGTVPPSTRPIPEPTRIEWDARAQTVKPNAYNAYFRIPCPAAADPARANPGEVFNVDTPAALACVLEAMRAEGASVEARAFLERYGVFLVGVEERGRVDTGSIAAAWLNMGRPEPVFLNSTPAMLPLSVLVGNAQTGPVRQWLAHPAYTSALRGETDVLAWPEYGTLTPEPPSPAGAQRFLASMPLRACRACAELAGLEVVFDFGADGEYLGWELLPPKAPAATPTAPAGTSTPSTGATALPSGTPPVSGTRIVIP